jgi:hypothetical protein
MVVLIRIHFYLYFLGLSGLIVLTSFCLMVLISLSMFLSYSYAEAHVHTHTHTHTCTDTYIHTHTHTHTDRVKSLGHNKANTDVRTVSQSKTLSFIENIYFLLTDFLYH